MDVLYGLQPIAWQRWRLSKCSMKYEKDAGGNRLGHIPNCGGGAMAVEEVKVVVVLLVEQAVLVVLRWWRKKR